jgi:hypothetical protein
MIASFARAQGKCGDSDTGCRARIRRNTRLIGCDCRDCLRATVRYDERRTGYAEADHPGAEDLSCRGDVIGRLVVHWRTDFVSAGKELGKVTPKFLALSVVTWCGLPKSRESAHRERALASNWASGRFLLLSYRCGEWVRNTHHSRQNANKMTPYSAMTRAAPAISIDLGFLLVGASHQEKRFPVHGTR